MNRRSVMALAVAIFLVCNFFGVLVTRAWFVSGGSLGAGEYTAAKVLYLPTLTPTPAEKSLYGSLLEGNQPPEGEEEGTQVFLVPGDEILSIPEGLDECYLSIENFSTVLSNVRVKVDINLPEMEAEFPEMADSMLWRRIDEGGDTYQYGMLTDLYDGETLVAEDVFMGLLEVTFASGQVKDTIIPNDTAPSGTFGESTYLWNPISEASTLPEQVSFEEAWEFKLNSSTDIPALGEDRQFYNVIKSLKIVGESIDPLYQNEFNGYFSNWYASQLINITISYYAKQSGLLMPWNEFSQSLLTFNTPLP